MRYFGSFLCAVALSSMASATASAATLSNGEWLQFNFTDGYVPGPGTGGGTIDGFNYYAAPNSSTNSTTGNATSVIDSAGNTVNGISVSSADWNGASYGEATRSWGGKGTQTPAAAAGAGTSTWSDDEIVNFWYGAGDETVTITGLDPTKQYDIYYYSKLNDSSSETHTLTVNGISQTTATRAARFADNDWDLKFAGVLPNGANSDTLSLSWAGGNPFVSAIVIQASSVPEPTSLGVVFGAATLLTVRRRRV